MQCLAVGSAMMLMMEALSHISATVRIEAVHFLQGETAATVSGEVSGYDSVRYVIGAGARQTISVRLVPGSESCALRVWTPGADEPDFADAMTGNDYLARHARPGVYTAQVHLTRAAARRGDTCAYRVNIELTGNADVLEKARRRGL